MVDAVHAGALRQQPLAIIRNHTGSERSGIRCTSTAPRRLGNFKTSGLTPGSASHGRGFQLMRLAFVARLSVLQRKDPAFVWQPERTRGDLGLELGQESIREGPSVHYVWQGCKRGPLETKSRLTMLLAVRHSVLGERGRGRLILHFLLLSHRLMRDRRVIQKHRR
jgi:hypothetical protein